MESLLTIVFFCLGAMSASFAGVVAERAYTGQSWMKGRSKCNSCGRYLGPLDLVPVFSWLASSGRCRSCGSRVPVSYALFEFTLGIAFVLSYGYLGPTLALLPFLISLIVLTFIVMYDLRHTLVPPVASSLLIALSLIYTLLASTSLTELAGTLLAAGIIGLAFLSAHLFSGGRMMGLGDAPVAFALALLSGAYALSMVLFSFWIGAIIGIAILALRRGGPRMGIEVPFVPFLALGFLLAYFIQWNPLALL
jgi:leader peptidase (prepilin peptidase) / N-methyltransferase